MIITLPTRDNPTKIRRATARATCFNCKRETLIAIGLDVVVDRAIDMPIDPRADIDGFNSAVKL